MAKSTRDRLASYVAERSTKPIQCKVCKLPDELRAAVEAELAKSTSAFVLSSFLKTEGISISADSLRNHKRVHVKASS